MHPYQVHSGPPPQLRFGGSLGLAKCGGWSATLLKWPAAPATFRKHCLWTVVVPCHARTDSYPASKKKGSPAISGNWTHSIFFRTASSELQALSLLCTVPKYLVIIQQLTVSKNLVLITPKFFPYAIIVMVKDLVLV